MYVGLAFTKKIVCQIDILEEGLKCNVRSISRKNKASMFTFTVIWIDLIL